MIDIFHFNSKVQSFQDVFFDSHCHIQFKELDNEPIESIVSKGGEFYALLLDEFSYCFSGMSLEDLGYLVMFMIDRPCDRILFSNVMDRLFFGLPCELSDFLVSYSYQKGSERGEMIDEYRRKGCLQLLLNTFDLSETSQGGGFF